MRFQLLNLIQRTLACLAVCLAACSPAMAGLAGKQFFVAFPGNAEQDDPQATLELHLRSTVTTQGTISGGGLATPKSFTVTPSAVTIVPMTSVAIPDRQPVAAAFRIASDQAIEVTVVSTKPASSYAYEAWPTLSGGLDYVALVPDQVGTANSGSQLLVIAQQDGTNIAVFPAANSGCPLPETTSLAAGDVFRVLACDVPYDLTGTVISSDKPVTVISASDCAYFGTGRPDSCDALAEILPPKTAAGTSYTLTSYAERAGDSVRVLSLQDNTTVSINGTPTVLGRNAVLSDIFDGVMSITSSAPVIVAQIANSAGFDNIETRIGDPSLNFPPPDVDGVSSATFSLFAVGAFEPSTVAHVSVTLPTAAIPDLRIDGNPVSGGLFTPVPGTSRSAANLDLGFGLHTLTSSAPFVATAYGFGDTDGYAYLIGRETPVIAPVVALLALSPDAQSVKIGSNACFTAAVTDSEGQPFAGQVVTFAVAGVNSSTTTQATDGSGAAQICITSSIMGSDSITATLGDRSDSSTVQWVALNAPTVMIDASADQIELGESITLNWSSTFASTCVASGSWTGAKPLSGSATQSPASTGDFSYTLTCTGADGESSQTVTVTVVPATPPTPTLVFNASPATLNLGQSVTLTWVATDASSCAASGAWSGAKAASGMETITPTLTGDLVFTLACGGAGGDAIQSRTVTVNAVADLDLPKPEKGGGAFGLETLALLALGIAAGFRRRPKIT